MTSGHLLVRRPSPALAQGELTHLDRAPVDAELALRQWQGYVDAFAAHGWTVHEIAPADDHPDGVFVEDTVVVFDDLAVLTSPGAASRRGEVATTEGALAALPAAVGRRSTRITEPGHLDGGDVLKIGRTAYVGLSGRTDEAGVAQLAALLEPRGWRVVAVPVTKVLHLKSGRDRPARRDRCRLSAPGRRRRRLRRASWPCRRSTAPPWSTSVSRPTGAAGP